MEVLMANRVVALIALIQQRIDSGKITPEALRHMDQSLKTTSVDLIQYQELQAAAHASGKITNEEAMTAYTLLGREMPSEEKWNKLAIPQKVAITQLMTELLAWKMKIRTQSNPTYYQEMMKKYGVPFDPSRVKGVKGFRFN